MKFPTLPESIRKLVPVGVSLFPRPEKRRWVFSYESGTGRLQRVVPGDIVVPLAALEYVVAYLREQGIDPGRTIEKRHTEGPTLDSCADRWLELCEKDPKVAPATLDGYRGQLKKWIRPTFGTTAMAAIAVPELRAWIRKIREQTGARTVQHIVSTMSRLYDCAMAESWLDIPANLVHHPGVRHEIPEAEGSRPIRLAAVDVQQLLDCRTVPLERRARYALAFTSGARDGELAGLRISRLRLEVDAPAFEVADAVALVGSKGDGPKFARVKATKNKGSKRTLPLHPAAIAALKEWIAVGWPELVGRDPSGEDFLFPRPDGQASRPRSADKIRDDLQLAGLSAEVDGQAVDFKATRSSFATWLDEAGVSDGARKKLMGHRASDVTEAHYTVRELATLAAAVATIPLGWTAGTVPAVVPAGTTRRAKSSELLAPPAGIGPATFGLGKRQQARRGGAGRCVPPAPAEVERACNIGTEAAIGQRNRSDRGAGIPSVVPRELVVPKAGIVALRLGWDPREATLHQVDDEL